MIMVEWYGAEVAGAWLLDSGIEADVLDPGFRRNDES